MDENGQIEKANLIVATGHNNYAMSRAVEEVARQYVHGPTVPEGMLNRVEAAIRAYDPCLSCSTHAVGRMPLDVAVCDAGGGGGAGEAVGARRGRARCGVADSGSEVCGFAAFRPRRIMPGRCGGTVDRGGAGR